MMKFAEKFDQPGGWKGQRDEGQGLKGLAVDVEETRRRNDGKVHLRATEDEGTKDEGA